MAQRKYYRKTYNKNKKIGKILKVLLGIFLFGFFATLSLFIYYAKDLPRPEDFREKVLILPTEIYDRTGEILLYQLFEEEKRIIVPLDQVSEQLIQAVIATEDAHFYSHFGIDYRGILRSIKKNLQIGQPVYGGSTISQQLIRSSLLTLEKTPVRKTREIILALELERRYSKDEILEFYLNQIPFGSNAYGIEAAAQTLFNKSAAEVSLEEAALLASLIKSPSYLSPYGPNKDELLARKNYVLDRMIAQSFISEKEAKEAKEQELEFAEIRHPVQAPHFVLYIKNHLESQYSDHFLRTNGLKVYTTLDWELQKEAEEAVKNAAVNNKAYNAHNIGLVAIDPNNGGILAMVGSLDWWATESFPEDCSPGVDCLFEPKFNVVTQGERQPGSAFKPFAYATLFRKELTNGLTPGTIVWDVKTEFNPNCSGVYFEAKDKYGADCYHPRNYDGKFRGPISLKEAFAQSINVPAVKVLYYAGLKETIALAKSFGITTLNQPFSYYGLPLVLGGGEVKLLDMTSAYGVFATGGFTVSPSGILRIEDEKGNVIEKNKKTPKRVLESQVANLINDILSDNDARTPVFGSRSNLYIPEHEVAVKTGTTQELKDAWVIGYTPSVAIGVWTGNNDGTPTLGLGVTLAAPAWNQVMKKALELYPPKDFVEPDISESEKIVLEDLIPEDSPQYANWQKAIQPWLEKDEDN
jgi:penicillin-binding protein 1A